MKDHEGGIRAFIWMTQAWYNKNFPNDREIMVGMYHPEYDGDYSTSGEFSFKWEELPSIGWTCQLKAWDDSWHALTVHFSDLLARLAHLDGENPTEEEIVEILKELDIKDVTPYVMGSERGVKPKDENNG